MSNQLKIVVSLAASTDEGRVRSHNEDDFVIIPDVVTTEGLSPSSKSFVLGKAGCLLVVADGMGGAEAGEVASQSTTQLIKKYVIANRLPKYDEEDIIPFVRFLVQKSYENILKIVEENLEYRGMGTTLVTAWVIGKVAYVGWVGDSRCYLYRKKKGMTQKTDDHSWVWEMVKSGQITPQEANQHENRNIITRCIGDSKIAPVVDFVTFSLEKGDKILLCSDGLNTMIDDPEIAEIIGRDSDLNAIAEHLIYAANRAGGEDNITVALLEVLELFDSKPHKKKGFWRKVANMFNK